MDETKKIADVSEVDEEQAEKEYMDALADFSKRLMVVELPKESDGNYTKFVKKIVGIDCILALINHEANLITPLPDEFEAPYDDLSLWTIAVKNTAELSGINKEASKPDENVYVITSHSRRALVCCDVFWNKVCEELGAMRLVISLYHKENDKTFILASTIDDEDKMDMKSYLHQVNKEEEFRTSYVFVRNVGMLSEAALNSEL